MYKYWKEIKASIVSIDPHQVGYEAVALLVQEEYVCTMQVWFYTIVPKWNGPLAVDIIRTHVARDE